MVIKLSSDQYQKLEEIRRKYNLKLILLHGSQATQRTHPLSDIDIAILKSSPEEEIDTLALIGELSEVFSSDKIDLAELDKADPLLLFSVVSKAKVLAGKERDFMALRLKAFRLYQDFKPYLRKREELIKKLLKELKEK